MSCSLYHLVSLATGLPVYVGLSRQPFERVGAHRRRWQEPHAFKVVATYPTRAEAETAETAEIKRLLDLGHDLWNIAKTPQGRAARQARSVPIRERSSRARWELAVITVVMKRASQLS